jgi:hypothetical protein
MNLDRLSVNGGSDLGGPDRGWNSYPLAGALPEAGLTESTARGHSDRERLDAPDHGGESWLRLM